MPFTYATEDGPLLLTMLEEGRYDVVVGNPPYITRQGQGPQPDLPLQVRERLQGHVRPHRAVHGAVLRLSQEVASSRLGRPDHQQLVHEARVRYQADRGLPGPPGPAPSSRIPRAPTSLAMAPQPSSSSAATSDPVGPTVRAVLGVRGEPGRPDDPAKGIVWTSIVEHVDDPGWDDEWITVTDLDRTLLATHPWSLSGGGAIGLLETIEAAAIETAQRSGRDYRQWTHAH